MSIDKIRYVVLDDVLFDHEILLKIGLDIENYDKEADVIMIGREQLIDLLKDAISRERNQLKGGDINNV